MKYRIKKLREAKGMTQEELARKSGISRATISGLENGKNDAPSISTLGRIAFALGVKVGQLFSEPV